MPYGIECDRYSIMGEILEYRLTRNEITREDICIMKLDVNGLLFDVCVPKREVMGEPAVGRRFKGNVWLQGRINFLICHAFGRSFRWQTLCMWINKEKMWINIFERYRDGENHPCIDFYRINR